MFIDIWDENNKAIKINKFSKDLNSSDVKKYENALREIIKITAGKQVMFKYDNKG